LQTTDVLDRVLAHIEARLFEPMTLADLTAVSGLSAFHFSRLFTLRHGESVMAYVRRRRLTAAAARLGAGDSRLIDLAFDCGFESQEAFTRAFKRAFGVTPGQYRRAGRTPDLEISPTERTPNVTPTASPPIDLVMRDGLTRREAFTVVGFSGRFDQADKAGIPMLWPRLAERLGFPGQVGWETYGVSWNIDPAEGGFSYMAAAAIAPGRATPEGLERLEIPAQAYVVFRQTVDGGPLQPQMLAGLKAIWSEHMPRSPYRLSGGPDFEFYPGDFEPNRAGAWIDIYLPVEAGPT
jgi:AraC family transcriptional regulator